MSVTMPGTEDAGVGLEARPTMSGVGPDARPATSGVGPDARPARIGPLTVDPPLVLGPMAGTTNRAFRLLCREGGAGLVCSEMVSINAIAQGNKRTLRMLRTFENEHPVSIQLFGAAPAIMRTVAPTVVAAGADLIDINMGCAVPKVRSAAAGVALMADPERAVALTRAAVEASDVPVTVKLRAGLAEGDISYVELARRLEDVGAAAVTLHARHAAQGFRGEAEWALIATLVEALSIPVIGSGDVIEPEDAARMMRITGCAAVMIARGALGRPWIFAQAAAALRGEHIPPDPPPAQRLALALRHAAMLVDECGERLAIHQMRAQLHHYVRGLPGARGFRNRANQTSTLAELRVLIEEYTAELDDAASASSDRNPGRDLP